MGKTNLSQNYYKGNQRRIEGLDSKGWWFTGGTSFMSNGYVIYKDGLDSWAPNPNAIAQGITYDYRMFDQRSLDSRASYAQFIKYLTDIADRAAQNEKKYLKLKLEQLRQSKIDVNWLDKIEAAIEQEDYNSAYTLLMRRDKNLEEFKREVNSNRNKTFAKTNEFFNSQFYKFIQDKFAAQLQNQSGLERFVELDTDFEKIVDEFLNSVFNMSIDTNSSLKFIRQQFIDGLEKIAEANGGKIFYKATLEKTINGSTLEQKGAKKISEGDILTKKGKFRSYGALAKKIAYDLMSGIGRGLSTELYTISAQSGIGGKSFSTGGVMKTITNAFTGDEYTVQGKTDAITYECFSATVSLDKIFESVYAQGYDEANKDFYDEVERQLKEAAANSTGEFFELATNVKGYVSNYDLQIEGAGSFANRMSTLSKIDLGGNMTNKLIFMLNNTTKGCIAENRIGELEDYLASVCVAWMWDNSDEIFDISSKEPSNFHKIYLFNSGGAYFTASQIIRQTVERLMGLDDNRFAKVIINPPSPYANYMGLMEETSIEGINTKDEWQKMLQGMWDQVKAEAMATGSMAIHFDQTELNELLSNLKAILNS